MALNENSVKDEKTMIREILSGKVELFEELISQHRLKLLSLMHSSKLSEHDAQEVMQQIQIKAFDKLNTFNPNYDFGGWIYTIARNTIRDYFREKSKIQTTDVDFQTNMYKVGLSSSPEDSVILFQSINEIKKLISSMDEKNQRIYELRFVKDFSYKEIAKEMNIPIGSVKTIIHRIKETISKKLLTEQ